MPFQRLKRSWPIHLDQHKSRWRSASMVLQNPRTWRGIQWHELSCREADNATKSPLLFISKVLYCFQPPRNGFMLTNRKFKSKSYLDSKSRLRIVIPVSRNHSRIAMHLTVVNPAIITLITIVNSLILIESKRLKATWSRLHPRIRNCWHSNWQSFGSTLRLLLLWTPLGDCWKTVPSLPKWGNC